MRRKLIEEKPSAILTGDWHLREDTPICRTDNFIQTQRNKLHQIQLLQEKYNIPIIHTGDLFDHWKPSPWLLTFAINYCPKDISIVYGNHDLPQHNLDEAHRAGLTTLSASKHLKILPEAHWGKEPKNESLFWPKTGKKMLVWHVLTWLGNNPPWPGAENEGMPAIELLKKYPDYNVIITGHNHTAFYVQHEGRLLVNPGGITRQTAAQINQEPLIYLWFEETNVLMTSYLQISEDAISRNHLEEKEKRDARITAFVENLNTTWQAENSFEENLEKFSSQNKVRKSVVDLIYKAMEGKDHE